MIEREHQPSPNETNGYQQASSSSTGGVWSDVEGLAKSFAEGGSGLYKQLDDNIPTLEGILPGLANDLKNEIAPSIP